MWLTDVEGSVSVGGCSDSRNSLDCELHTESVHNLFI